MNANLTVLAAAIHTPGRNMGLLEGAAARSWSLGIVEQSQCKGCCWLHRQIEGMGGRRLWWGMPVEESQAATEARRCCWVTQRGWSHHHSLSPQASISSWTERLAHQTPQALNYRARPQPGCPFKCLTRPSTEKDPRQGGALYVPDVRDNREGPQAGGPSMCLMWGTTEKDPS